MIRTYYTKLDAFSFMLTAIGLALVARDVALSVPKVVFVFGGSFAIFGIVLFGRGLVRILKLRIYGHHRKRQTSHCAPGSAKRPYREGAVQGGCPRNLATRRNDQSMTINLESLAAHPERPHAGT